MRFLRCWPYFVAGILLGGSGRTREAKSSLGSTETPILKKWLIYGMYGHIHRQRYMRLRISELACACGGQRARLCVRKTQTSSRAPCRAWPNNRAVPTLLANRAVPTLLAAVFRRPQIGTFVCTHGTRAHSAQRTNARALAHERASERTKGRAFHAWRRSGSQSAYTSLGRIATPRPTASRPV